MPIDATDVILLLFLCENYTFSGLRKLLNFWKRWKRFQPKLNFLYPEKVTVVVFNFFKTDETKFDLKSGTQVSTAAAAEAALTNLRNLLERRRTRRAAADKFATVQTLFFSSPKISTCWMKTHFNNNLDHLDTSLPIPSH